MLMTLQADNVVANAQVYFRGTHNNLNDKSNDINAIFDKINVLSCQ